MEFNGTGWGAPAALFVVLATTGCTGVLDASSDGTGEEGNGTAETAESGSAVEVPGGRRVWRLTRAQYDNTVQDLLGTSATPAREFLPEEGGTGFRNAEFTLGFSDANFFDFEQAARALAEEAVTQRLSSVLPCADAADDACAREFIDGFGSRAFRRPLLDEETAAYFDLYDSVKADLDGVTGIRMVIEAMLISPNFLFRSELGPASSEGTGTIELTDYEVASQLSYTIWNTMPDAELFEAAASGSLSDPAERERHASRLLDAPGAVPVLTDLYMQLLEYEKLESSNKADELSNFEPAREYMAEETRLLLHEVIEEQTPLTELFTADYSYVNEPLAQIYGLEGISGNDMQRVQLPAQRAGVLTHPGFLSIQATAGDSSPVRRGYFILHELLCQEIAEPSADIMVSQPPPSDTKTTRERFEEQTQTEAPCKTCHSVLNPPGFLFEDFDAIGSHRTEENGVPVDTSATLVSAGSLEGSYAGFDEFSSQLANSSELARCMALQNVRFALGRMEAPVDESAIEEMQSIIEQGRGGPRELLLALVTHETFVQRLE